MLSYKLDDQMTVSEVHCACRNHNSFQPFLRDEVERVRIVGGCVLCPKHFDPELSMNLLECRRHILFAPRFPLRLQEGHAGQPWPNFLEKLHPLDEKIVAWTDERSNTRNIPTRSREALYKTCLDRIASQHHDWRCLRDLFGCARRGVSGGNNDIGLLSYELTHNSVKFGEIALRGPPIEDDVVSLYIS